MLFSSIASYRFRVGSERGKVLVQAKERQLCTGTEPKDDGDEEVFVGARVAVNSNRSKFANNFSHTFDIGSFLSTSENLFGALHPLSSNLVHQYLLIAKRNRKE